MTRSFDELIDKAEPGWPLVQQWISEAINHVEVLPPVEENRRPALVAICLTRMQLSDRYQFDWAPSAAEQGAPSAP